MFNMFNMLNKPNNVIAVNKIGGSLFVNLSAYLRDLGVAEGDFVVINSETQLRAFSESKIITIEKFMGEKK